MQWPNQNSLSTQKNNKNGAFLHHICYDLFTHSFHIHFSASYRNYGPLYRLYFCCTSPPIFLTATRHAALLVRLIPVFTDVQAANGGAWERRLGGSTLTPWTFIPLFRVD